MTKPQQNAEHDSSIPSRLFHIASHDLKSPLGNLRMAEHLLRENLENLDDEIVHILDMMRISVDNMQVIINNFLEIIELQSQPIDVSLVPVRLVDVMAEVFSQHEGVAAEKQIALTIHCEGKTALTDEKRLIQVISNFVSNALKYSPHGSTVTIESSRQDNDVRISVIDEGPGIKEDERHHLFSQIGRLSNRPTGTETSTGLGLWIVNQIVTALNGQVGADFPDAGGSCFWVQIPACGQD